MAVTFAATAPAGVAAGGQAGPAGCAYWKQAGEGAVFYTEAADHYNCPVGSYTHGVALPPERAKELEDVVGTMVGLQYIRMEEVGALPRRTSRVRRRGVRPARPDARRRRTWCSCAAARARSCWWPRPRGRPGIAGDGGRDGPPRLRDDPRGARGARRRHQPRLHRQPGLHRAGRRRALLHDSRAAKVGEVVERLETVLNANRELEKYHQARRAVAVARLQARRRRSGGWGYNRSP